LPPNLRVLAVDGVVPGQRSVADETYALWRQLHLVTAGEPAGEVRDFAQWLLGPEGQRISQQFAAARGPTG
jgi:phosphate transport system substrate-binding protein